MSATNQFADRWMFQIASKADESVSIEERHANLLPALMRHERPWGLKGLAEPPVPLTGTSDEIFFVGLTRQIKTPIRSAEIGYARRSQGRFLYPDLINFNFNKKKVSLSQFKYLVHVALPDYIAAFDAQRLYLTPQDAYVNFMNYADGDYNQPVCRDFYPIAPVNFWSEAYCQEWFKRNAAEIAAILEREGVPFRWIGDGIYVVFTDELVSDEIAMNYETRFRPLLDLNSRA